MTLRRTFCCSLSFFYLNIFCLSSLAASSRSVLPACPARSGHDEEKEEVKEEVKESACSFSSFFTSSFVAGAAAGSAAVCGVPGAGGDRKKVKGKEKEDNNGETTPHKVIGGS